jgi:hypothetical protein
MTSDPTGRWSSRKLVHVWSTRHRSLLSTVAESTCDTHSQALGGGSSQKGLV